MTSPPPRPRTAWFVYLLRCGDDSLYCGVTPDLARRLAAHREGRGARYTRAHLPVRLVYWERQASRSVAQQREAEIKRWPRSRKLALVGAGRRQGRRREG